MSEDLTKAQKKELAQLRKSSIRIKKGNSLTTVYDSLVEGGEAISKEDGDYMVYSLAPANRNIDPSTAKLTAGQKLEFLEYSGYKDTGYRSLLQSEANEEAKRLRGMGEAASVHPCSIRRGVNAYAVMSKGPGTNVRTGQAFSSLAKRASAVQSHPAVVAAIATLRDAVDTAEADA